MGLKKSSGDNHYYEFAYPSYSLLNARVQFLGAVSKRAPEVFERLHGEPSRMYRDSGLLKMHRKKRVDFWRACSGGADLYKREDPNWMGISLTDRVQSAITNYAYLFFPDWGLDIADDRHIDYFNTRIRPSLIAWAERLERWAGESNLIAGWLYEWAFLKLDSYADQRNPGGPIYLELNPQIKMDIFGAAVQPPIVEHYYIDKAANFDFWIEEFRFYSDPWRPLIQTRADCEKRVREDFERALKRYFEDGVRWLDLRPNLQRSRVKAEPAHYEWLARYQCRQERIADIAATVGERRGRSTVKDAIDDVSEFIGLPLRPPDPPGRREGTKDTKPRKNRRTARTK